MALVEQTPTLTERRLARMPEAHAISRADQHADAIEQLLIKGDLKSLTVEQRNVYYMRLCDVTGLNPLTQPFEYLTLNGKLVLYAKKACTDQLRAINKISVIDMDQEENEGLYTVTVKVQNGEGRMDMDVGSVNIAGLKGDARANAIMKASTKAKRRATLSICGLGLLDETEVETIPGAIMGQEAAGGAPEPQSQPRQQRSSSASAKRDDVWGRFERTLMSYRDADELADWWADAGTQAKIDQMPAAWQEQAVEAFEKRRDVLKDAS